MKIENSVLLYSAISAVSILIISKLIWSRRKTRKPEEKKKLRPCLTFLILPKIIEKEEIKDELTKQNKNKGKIKNYIEKVNKKEGISKNFQKKDQIFFFLLNNVSALAEKKDNLRKKNNLAIK